MFLEWQTNILRFSSVLFYFSWYQMHLKNQSIKGYSISNMFRFQEFNQVVKVNKSVYIASHTYWFWWQYAIISVWKTWSSSLNQLNRSNVKLLSQLLNVLWFLLTKAYLSTVYRNDWSKLTFNCFFFIQCFLFCLIWLCYNFFDRTWETNMYEKKSKRLRLQILTCLVCTVLFSKISRFHWKK